MKQANAIPSTPNRPQAVSLAAAGLLASAVVLLLTWLLRVDDVASNGARVFFVVLWGYLAWSAYQGGGWVRTAIVAVCVVTVWGFVNAPSVAEALLAMPPGDQLARVLALAALAAMFTPPAHRWFATVKELRSQAQES